ncbi:MAG: diphthamide synthesis protein [Candidatus Woesearchaeota archaeon]
MKTLFIHAHSTRKVVIPRAVLKKLPRKVGVVASIQFANQIPAIVKQVPGSIAGGQVLGCNAAMALKLASRVDAYLFVGSGVFHPINVAIQSKKPVFCFNPYTNEFKELDKNEVLAYEKARKGAVLKFLNAKSVGIIVSTKPGQKNLQRALQLKKKGDKEYFIFACDTFDFRHLEDFNFIDCWVNTACPRMDDQKAGIVSINDLVSEGIVKFKHVPEGYEVPIWMGTKGFALK